MSINAATSQTQLYQSLFGQNGTTAAGTAATGAAGATPSAGQDVSSLLQELLGGAAGTAQGTPSAPSPVSNTSPSSQLASNTLASLLSAQGGVSDLNSIISELATVANTNGGGLTGAALAQQESGQPSSAQVGGAADIAGTSAPSGGPKGASGGGGSGGESISSILATLLAESESALLGTTSSLGTTSLSASSVASTSSPSDGSTATASAGPTASVATLALNQLADLLQNLAAQLATSQYSNANQLTNPTTVGATVSSVA
jgi:hypothetical protein